MAAPAPRVRRRNPAWSWSSWLADDEERGAVGHRAVLLIRGLELEGDEVHVTARGDRGQPSRRADAVARTDRSLKGEPLLTVHQVRDVQRHLLVGPELPVGVEAGDPRVGWGRAQRAIFLHIAYGRHVVA